MNAIPVTLPPLPEQKRIVDKVEQLLGQVNAARERLAKVPLILKAFRQSVLAAACSGRLTVDWREQHPDLEPASELLKRITAERKAALGKKYREPEPVDTSDLPDLLEGWEWAALAEVAAPEPNSLTDGPFGSNLKTSHYTSRGPRVVRLQNIGDAVFLDHQAHISEEHYAQLNKHWIHAGDVAIAAMGAPPPRACLIPDFVGPAIVKADCMRLKPEDSVASARYVNCALNTNLIKHLTASEVHGVSRPRLSLGEVRRIPIPLPPRPEQQEIVRRVEALFALADAIGKRVAAAAARADKLTQSILAKAFRGELVPTEAELARKEGRDYEPASVLLERIRQERSHEQKPTRTGKRKR